jgi:cupin fold WbuC family metalloprotein
MKIELIDEALLEETIARAEASPRLRTNHNFHPTLEDNPHRFLNVMRRGTYVTPHRHLDPPKSEAFVILRGTIAFFTFDDRGELERTHVLGDPSQREHPYGIDIAPGVWHALAPLSETVVCYEVKPGPYSATNDKDFAPWAPPEGDARCAEYVEALLRRAGIRNLDG